MRGANFSFPFFSRLFYSAENNKLNAACHRDFCQRHVDSARSAKEKKMELKNGFKLSTLTIFVKLNLMKLFCRF